MPRILFVEDDEAFSYSAAKALGQAGYDVVTAPSYFLALRELNGETPIDLLITDVVMPNGINGFALARMARLRQRNLKILYVTGFDVPTDEAIGTILRKPVAADQLVQQVRLSLAA